MSREPGPIRILAVDDHALLREGIAALVNTESDMKLVAEASNGQEAILKFRSHRPDVTLMGLQMPALNGIKVSIGFDAAGARRVQNRRVLPRRRSWRLNKLQPKGNRTRLPAASPNAHLCGRQ